MIVLVGLAEPAVTNTLPSMIPRFATSWDMHQRSTTDDAGSSPILAVPMKWPFGRPRAESTRHAPAVRSDSSAWAICHWIIARAFSERRYVIFGAATPDESHADAESSTRLASSGRSSQRIAHIALRPRRSRT